MQYTALYRHVVNLIRIRSIKCKLIFSSDLQAIELNPIGLFELFISYLIIISK